MAGNISNTASPITSSLSKLQSLNGLFAIYKKQGPTSADVLNKLKEALLKGKEENPCIIRSCCFLVKLLKLSDECLGSFVSEAGVQNPNPRKRKKQTLKMGHGGTLDSAASGVLGKRNVTLTPRVKGKPTVFLRPQESYDLIKW